MIVETSNRAHVANAAAEQLPKSPKTKAFEGVVMYYGYRWYDPETGRWPSRDPIQEQGGLNLYGFCYNDPNGWIDRLGREPQKPKPVPSEKYWNDNYKERFKKLSPEANRRLKEQFEDGCIGITCLNIGAEHMPDLKNCYLAESGKIEDIVKALDAAKKRQTEMVDDCKKNRNCKPVPGETVSKPQIFSIRFHLRGRRPPSRTSLDGRVSLEEWNPKKGHKDPKEGDLTKFDFGFYDAANNKWIHANGEAPGMEVYISTLEYYSRELIDFDTQVFCVACEDWVYGK